MNIHDDAFVVISNNAVIVLENKSDQAILTSGTGGNVISEGEFNRIDWHIQDATGTYEIPFTTNALINGGNETKIPLTLSVTGSGTNSGFISFSTYETATDQNTVYPTTVTTMDNTAGVDGSLKVADRFWIVDTNNYLTPPIATMDISYDDAPNEIGGTNTINENNLLAQRWNPLVNDWETLLFGINDAANNKVMAVNTSPEFYPVWTLVDFSQPLPVTLTSFEGDCSDRKIMLNWTTVSETNNDYFIIERSLDAVNFEMIGTINGMGTSTATNHYSFTTSTEGVEINYFRLTQVDFNGEYQSWAEIVATSCESLEHWTVVPNPSNGIITVLGASNESVSVFDASGRLVHIGETSSQMNLSQLSSGCYIARINAEIPAQVRFVIY